MNTLVLNQPRNGYLTFILKVLHAPHLILIKLNPPIQIVKIPVLIILSRMTPQSIITYQYNSVKPRDRNDKNPSARLMLALYSKHLHRPSHTSTLISSLPTRMQPQSAWHHQNPPFQKQVSYHPDSGGEETAGQR